MQGPAHPWIARSIVGSTMILLSLIGLIASDISHDGAWTYWRIMAPVFALICISFSFYLRKKHQHVSLVKIWHEILHWLSLVGAIFLISSFVSMGIMGRFVASLTILVILGVTTFIAGIYIESSYLIVGIALGLCAAAAAFIQEYVYTIMLPCSLVLIGVIWWLSHRANANKNDEDPDSL